MREFKLTTVLITSFSQREACLNGTVSVLPVYSYSSGKVRKLPLEPRTVRYSYRVFIKSSKLLFMPLFLFPSFFSPLVLCFSWCAGTASCSKILSSFVILDGKKRSSSASPSGDQAAKYDDTILPNSDEMKNKKRNKKSRCYRRVWTANLP